MRAGFVSTLVLLVGGAGGCPEPSVSPLPFGPWMDLPAPSPADGEDLCLEVAASRFCWSAGPGARPRPVARPLPALEVPGGYRCFGPGEDRRCQPRSVGAGPWHCEEDRGCRRAHPRRPDDGEWECTEVAGAVLCRYHGASAGVIPGPPDPAWLCGGEPRICLDLSPDLPPSMTQAGARASEADELRFACRFPLAPGEPRACVREAGVRRLGDRCQGAEACPAEADCLAGYCLPRQRPDPGCWTDRDCPEAMACVLGTCGVRRP